VTSINPVERRFVPRRALLIGWGQLASDLPAALFGWFFVLVFQLFCKYLPNESDRTRQKIFPAGHFHLRLAANFFTRKFGGGGLQWRTRF
jgi:hypothetical protein